MGIYGLGPEIGCIWWASAPTVGVTTMLRPLRSRTLHWRASTCTTRRVGAVVSRRASRPRSGARPCATYAGPRHGTPPSGADRPHATPATPLPSRWLQELSARVGTRVGRLL